MPSEIPKSHPSHKRKLPLIIFLVLLLVAAGVGSFYLFKMHHANTDIAASDPGGPAKTPIYNHFTGEEIADDTINSSPLFCIQIPNGSTDGARPQVGLNQAGIIFEAIAETGITRFAAIFQNPTSSAIGPVRSLRPYYLEWDTPFDCTVVHAGGSDEALAAISAGGQRNLDEDYTYMWRENSSNRLWNNLFVSPATLAEFNATHGYTKSSPKTFPRLTPTASSEQREAHRTCQADPECSDEITDASRITISFNQSMPYYTTIYEYSQETNSYARSYRQGGPHLVYDCPAELVQPNTKTQCGEPIQLAPQIVIAMHVREHTMSDNYHESIQTIGSGRAEIFQNGTVTQGTWEKSSLRDQIVFKDGSGAVISFTPGQIWIAAVPQFGSLDYESI